MNSVRYCVYIYVSFSVVVNFLVSFILWRAGTTLPAVKVQDGKKATSTEIVLKDLNALPGFKQSPGWHKAYQSNTDFGASKEQPHRI